MVRFPESVVTPFFAITNLTTAVVRSPRRLARASVVAPGSASERNRVTEPPSSVAFASVAVAGTTRLT